MNKTTGPKAVLLLAIAGSGSAVLTMVTCRFVGRQAGEFYQGLVFGAVSRNALVEEKSYFGGIHQAA